MSDNVFPSSETGIPRGWSNLCHNCVIENSSSPPPPPHTHFNEWLPDTVLGRAHHCLDAFPLSNSAPLASSSIVCKINGMIAGMPQNVISESYLVVTGCKKSLRGFLRIFWTADQKCPHIPFPRVFICFVPSLKTFICKVKSPGIPIHLDSCKWNTHWSSEVKLFCTFNIQTIPRKVYHSLFTKGFSEQTGLNMEGTLTTNALVESPKKTSTLW